MPNPKTTTDPSQNGQVPDPTPAAPPGEVVYNPLKLSSLRSKSSVLKGVWTDPSRVPIYSRPDVNTWVRVRPGEEYTDIIDLLVATNASNSKDRNPLYVVTDDVRPELERFLKPHRVMVGITYHDKVQFLWVRAISTGSNSWTDSVMSAMDEALTDWVSLETDHALDEYKRHHAPHSKEWGDPKWPDQTLEDVVNLAFRDRIIDSLDHTVAKRLLGRD
jgi:hypothetical protein